jgi:hypothetical protein
MIVSNGLETMWNGEDMADFEILSQPLPEMTE